MRVEQVVGGVIYSANEIEAPGVIKNNSPDHNRLEIGSIAGPDKTTLVRSCAPILMKPVSRRRSWRTSGMPFGRSCSPT